MLSCDGKRLINKFYLTQGRAYPFAPCGTQSRFGSVTSEWAMATQSIQASFPMLTRLSAKPTWFESKAKTLVCDTIWHGCIARLCGIPNRLRYSSIPSACCSITSSFERFLFPLSLSFHLQNTILEAKVGAFYSNLFIKSPTLSKASWLLLSCKWVSKQVCT